MEGKINPPCELCNTDGGALIFRANKWRVVRVEGAEGDAYRGFCRVVWNAHVREMTDLSAGDRAEFMDAVFKIESALRASLAPEKVNLASLGNLTPHLHWHVIPRFVDDAAFPKPIWAHSLTAPPSLDTLTPGHRRGNLAAQDGQWEQAVRRALNSD